MAYLVPGNVLVLEDKGANRTDQGEVLMAPEDDPSILLNLYVDGVLESCNNYLR